MNNEELNKKRFIELSHRAYERGFTTYSNFLNMDEISLLKSTKCDTQHQLFGGYENAVRCVAGFSEYDVFDYPIDCIKIDPLQQKFADKLTHRDFLGAIMNLGIEREMLGDIIIENNVGYLFCINKISNYIIEQLYRINHTTVKCSIIDNMPKILSKLPDENEYIVSSLRVDTVSSTVFRISRNAVSQLINQGKVYINSKIIYKEAVLLKENDVVSIRGYGKFIYSRSISETKKHKIVIAIRLYK